MEGLARDEYDELEKEVIDKSTDQDVIDMNEV